MSYPAKEILLQAKHLITRPRTTRRYVGDEEERQHSVAWEHNSPRSPHSPPPLPQLELGARRSLAPGLDNVTLSHRYSLIAQGILSSLPSSIRVLGAHDLTIEDKPPVGAGGFTDILEATHDGRRVVLKVYRCYESFDVDRVATVRCGGLCRVYC